MLVQVIIPVHFPDRKFRACLTALKKQSMHDLRVLLIDSGSKQSDWLNLAHDLRAQIITIDEGKFDHGGTRQMGVEYTADADIHVFLTQDAVLSNENSLARLIAVFEDPQIGCAYGRQLPHMDADFFSAHARAFNYPAQSQKRSYSDRKRYGVKTAFCSNSFAAYRYSALSEVGGFPKHTILSEDMFVTAKMLQAGWSVAYVAEATVKHSHNYTIAQEFHRYFDIGVFHHREEWICKSFGRAEGEGKRFIQDELCALMQRAPYLLPQMIVRAVVKYLGYRLGLVEKIIPVWMKKSMAMNASFFSEARQ